MEQITSFVGYCFLFLVFVLIGWYIGEYLNQRRFWKQIKIHFENRAKESNKIVMEAFIKALESDKAQQYLIQIFRHGQSKKD